MLWILVRDEIGKRSASKTVIYMLLFPTAFYFTTMYTESLFLFLSVSMFYFAKKQNWLAVGIFGFLVSLSRMQGALLFIPIAYMYMRTVDFKLSKINRKVLYLLGIPVGLATFMFYEYLITGDPLIQLKSAVLFGKQLSLPWTGFEFSLRAIFMDTTLINVAYHVYTLLITVAFIVLAYISYKKLKHEYTIYYVLSLLIIIVSSNLFGATRYFLMAFPAFMALSLIDDKNKFIKYGIIVVYVLFVLLMAGSIVLHVTERISTPILYTPMF